MRAALRLLFIYIGLVVAATTQDHPIDPPATTTTEDTKPTSGPYTTNDTKDTKCLSSAPHLLGFRIDHNASSYSPGRIAIPPDKTIVTVYGLNLNRISKIELVRHGCGNTTAGGVSILTRDFVRRSPTILEIEWTAAVGVFELCPYYVRSEKEDCPFERNKDGEIFRPITVDGVAKALNDEDRTIIVREPDVPPRTYKLGHLWLEIIFLVFLHVCSALFSGLTLGLMTLTVRELEIIAKSGSEQEQKYANAILPLRRKGNQLLCTLLLGNTLCNASISILIDDLLPPEYSVWAATLTMLLLGEMLPQSICVNNALATGARMLFFARFCMYVGAVFAWPISKVLDRVVGAEHESYDRKRLMELMERLMLNNPDMVKDELKIAAGAINLKRRIVVDSMTKIEEVFMLPETAMLNQTAIANIARAGYTRIPVFRQGDQRDICDVLITKDLALIDPDDNYTVRMLCNIYKHPIPRMSGQTTLFSALQTFRTGDDGHLAVVYRESNNETIGIITLEDVVEEILQEEIKDEFDLKREKKGNQKILWDQQAPPAVLGKQLLSVTYHFCATNEEAFKDKYIDKAVFKRIMGTCTKNVDVNYLKPFGGALTVPIKQLPRCARLYTKDEPSDRYILILEGRAEVTIGQGGMKFEAGPFHRFGQELLAKLVMHADDLCKGPSESTLDLKPLMQFNPDFSVTVFEDCIFLEVTADMYIKALRMTRLQRETKGASAERTDFKQPSDAARAPLIGHSSRERLPQSPARSATSPKGAKARTATLSRTQSSSPAVTESSNRAREGGGGKGKGK